MGSAAARPSAATWRSAYARHLTPGAWRFYQLPAVQPFAPPPAGTSQLRMTLPSSFFV